MTNHLAMQRPQQWNVCFILFTALIWLGWDHDVFGPFIEALRDGRFTSDNEVKEVAQTWSPKQLFLARNEDFNRAV